MESTEDSSSKYDARPGGTHWRQCTTSGVIGWPSKSSLDGAQTVVALCGYGVDAAREQASFNQIGDNLTCLPHGGLLWVFAPSKH